MKPLLTRRTVDGDLAVWLTALGVAALLYFPYLFVAEMAGGIDQDYFLATQLAANDALSQGEILHWNPYLCGGFPGLANPQSRALSPFNVIGLIMNPLWQMKVILILHLILGIVGVLMIGRHWRLARGAILIGAVVWVANGFIFFRVLHAHMTFYPLLLLPLLFYWLLRANDKPFSPGPPALAIGLLALTILSDGLQALIYMLTTLGTAALVMDWQRRSWRFSAHLAAWVAIAVLLTLPRTLPIFDLLNSQARAGEHTDFMTLGMLFDALLNPDQLALYRNVDITPPHRYWMAYSAYIGLPVLGLALVGLFYKAQRAMVGVLVAVTLVGLAIAVGNHGSWTPWALLGHLPVFDSIRMPSRFLSIVGFAVTLLAMLGSALLLGTVKQRLKWPLSAALILLCIGSSYLALTPVRDQVLNQQFMPATHINHGNAFRHRNGAPTRMFEATMANVGSLDCYEAFEIRGYADSNKPLAWSASGASQVEATLKPNAINLALAVRAEDAIFINMNWHPYWGHDNPDVGPLRRTQAGYMGLVVKPGDYRLQLHYQDPVFLLGLAISGTVAILLLIGLLLYLRSDRARQTKSAHLHRQ